MNIQNIMISEIDKNLGSKDKKQRLVLIPQKLGDKDLNVYFPSLYVGIREEIT